MRFVVVGRPAPQGSKRVIPQFKDGRPTGRFNVVESSKERVRTWRDDVKATAMDQAAGIERLTGALYVEIAFYLPRPKDHYGTGRNKGQVKPSAPRYPGTQPDLAKLARSTEDALTDAGVWADDALIVREYLTKDYADPDAVLAVPGAVITVYEVEEDVTPPAAVGVSQAGI